MALKGQCHEIFCFWFFSWISSPKPLRILKAVSNFFENSRRYSQLKVDHRCQRHRRQFCRRYRRRWQICHRYQRHRWQTMRLISGWGYLKVNLKAKMLTLLSKGVPTKLLKIFRLKIFSFATGVSDTGSQPWAANISATFGKNSKRS